MENPLPIRTRDRLNRLRFKLEQMVAWYKQCEDELKAEYSTRKKKIIIVFLRFVV